MARTKLTLTVNCGKTTCASKPGRFCRFFGSRKFGQVPICTLFPDELGTNTFLQEQDGWVQRCPACLEAQS